MTEPVEIICKHCKNVFKSENPRKKVCIDCENKIKKDAEKRYRENNREKLRLMNRRYGKNRKKKRMRQQNDENKPTLGEIAKAAKAANMSYGEYVILLQERKEK